MELLLSRLVSTEDGRVTKALVAIQETRVEIAFALWGIAERKLLPKPKLDKDGKPIPEEKAVKPAPKPERRKKPEPGKDRPKRKSRK